MNQKYKDISVKFIFVSISSGGDGTNYDSQVCSSLVTQTSFETNYESMVIDTTEVFYFFLSLNRKRKHHQKKKASHLGLHT